MVLWLGQAGFGGRVSEHQWPAAAWDHECWVQQRSALARRMGGPCLPGGGNNGQAKQWSRHRARRGLGTPRGLEAHLGRLESGAARGAIGELERVYAAMMAALAAEERRVQASAHAITALRADAARLGGQPSGMCCCWRPSTGALHISVVL